MAAANRHEALVTVEENAIAGGAGSGVNELLAAEGATASVLNLGLDDQYIQHATREECLHQAGLDEEGILARIVRRFAPGGQAVEDDSLRESSA
jgi:1-deoxy-D-xylulose-5-phosphate synthase